VRSSLGRDELCPFAFARLRGKQVEHSNGQGTAACGGWVASVCHPEDGTGQLHGSKRTGELEY
jgi:hypothetical protein